MLAAACVGSAPGDTPPVPTFAYDKADGTQAAACSADYWAWINNTYLPMLDRPVEEIGAAELAAEASKRPASEETKYSYDLCWQPFFNKYVFAAIAERFRLAEESYLDHTSPDFLDYAAYLSHTELTPKLRRDAAALLALRPATVSREGFTSWMFGYSTLLGDFINPVGLAGPNGYTNDVDEAAWTITPQEGESLSLVEAARAEPNQPGTFYEWMGTFKGWMFGPPPSVQNLAVFNFAWEQGRDFTGFGDISGAEIYQCTAPDPFTGMPSRYPDCSRNGDPFLPDAVRAFVTRLSATRPALLSDMDSSGWMIQFDARMTRTLADRAGNEPVVHKTDDLVLDVLDEVRPGSLTGLFSYQTWLDLYGLTLRVTSEASLRDRVVRTKPCVSATDLPAAAGQFDQRRAALAMSSPMAVDLAAPAVCP